MPATLYVSFRRNDSSIAARLIDRLNGEFSPDLRVENPYNIAPGVNFITHIRQKISSCAIVIVMIGSEWRNAAYEDGTPRLSSPDDVVRLELALALSEDKTILPILANGANMPNPASLPEDIRGIVRRQGMTLNDSSFDEDMENVCWAVTQLASATIGRNLRRKRRTAEGSGRIQAYDKLFISYRRNDSSEAAREIYNRLARKYSHNNIFVDVDSIHKGRDYREVIDESLDRCRVMLVLIGPGWLNAADANGVRRLSNPTDLVRLEIETALQRNINVIPVLLANAQMPTELDLPDEMKSLAYRHAAILRKVSFGSDLNDLENSFIPLLRWKKKWLPGVWGLPRWRG